MKKSYLWVIVCLLSMLPSALLSQAKDEKPKQSKLDEFSSRTGQLIQRKFTDIGTFKSVKVKVLTLTDVLTHKSASGVRFEKVSYIGNSSRTAICFLDQDEVDDAIKALKYLKSDVVTNTTDIYTEYEFTSRSDFEVGCFSRDKNWVGFVRVSRYDDGLISFNVTEFDSLLKMLEDAKAKLPAK